MVDKYEQPKERASELWGDNSDSKNGSKIRKEHHEYLRRLLYSDYF